MSKIGDDAGIHIRAVRFGYEERPNGFTYGEIKKKYETKIKKEWLVVDTFLHNAYDNFNHRLNRDTPYVLLENNDLENSKFTLSYNAYFLYTQFKELQQAKKDTELAQKIARNALRYTLLTLIVAIITLLASIYFSWQQIKSPTKIDENQINKIVNTINKRVFNCHSREGGNLVSNYCSYFSWPQEK